MRDFDTGGVLTPMYFGRWLGGCFVMGFCCCMIFEGFCGLLCFHVESNAGRLFVLCLAGCLFAISGLMICDCLLLGLI